MDVIIALVIILVFVSVGSIFAYQILASGSKTVKVGKESVTFKCPPGQCSTDIQTGFKICPSNDTDSIVVDPEVAVCNSRYFCDNPVTPYAQNFDQSTNFNGVCPTNVQCPCLRRAYCPVYVTSIFTTDNGDPYQNIDGQRITFPQVSTYSSATGTVQSQPIILDSPGTQFCFAPLNWLPVANPGCPNLSRFDATGAYEDLLDCMGGALGCNGYNHTPCSEGTLAIIADTVDDVTIDQIPTSVLGCVRGNPCPCGNIAVFDKQFGAVVCRSLN